MTLFNDFWESIGRKLEKMEGLKPISEWTQSDIVIFLNDKFYSKLIKIIKDDPIKAELCGIPEIRGQSAFEQLRPISPISFRRIFQYKISNGNPVTKNQFAIYLGYKSYRDYIQKNNIQLKKQKSIETKTKWTKVKYIEAVNLESLEKKVIEYLKKGWELHESLVIKNTVIAGPKYYQALKKRAEK